jgi:hypothetical protein
MSALPPKADIVQRSVNVRYVPKADIPGGRSDVRFTPQSGHRMSALACLLGAISKLL